MEITISSSGDRGFVVADCGSVDAGAPLLLLLLLLLLSSALAFASVD